MHTSWLVGWLLTAVGTVTGLACLLRAAAGCAAGHGERRTARSEGLMGLGMAAMAVPVHALHPHPWGPALFAVLFAVAALRSALLARRAAHHLHHAVAAAAMVYMAVLAAAARPAAGGAMAGMAMGSAPAAETAVTGVLICYFAGYAVWAGARMPPAPAQGGPPGIPVVGSPEMVAACRVSMGVGMLAMLMLM